MLAFETSISYAEVKPGLGKEYMVGVSDGVCISQGIMIRNILSLEVTPGLRCSHLRPHVVKAIVHGLLSGDPVVSASTKALAFVVGFLPALVVEPVGQKVVCILSEPGSISLRQD